MISAQIVADSKNEFGNRLTTMVVTMPRIILAEFNTHRMFSRNSASSRAIPFAKMVKSVEDNPFIPIAWQKDHKGMQGTEYIGTLDKIKFRTNLWLRARDKAIVSAKGLHGDVYGPKLVRTVDVDGEGVTKQICNRLLEPFMWHTVIISATEFENFFALRCPQYIGDEGKIYRSKKDLVKYRIDPSWSPDYYDTVGWLEMNKGQAEIHMMALAEAMWDAYNKSTPRLLKAGEWHIPFQVEIWKLVDNEWKEQYVNKFETKEDWDRDLTDMIKISTVMIARTSYTVVGEDQKPLSYQRMLEIDTQLINANPVHASPLEHCAECAGDSGSYYNLNGFKSRRFLLGK